MINIKRNKIMGLFLGMLTFVIFPKAILAASVSFDGPTAVAPGEEFTYTIVLNDVEAFGNDNTFSTVINFDTKIFSFKKIESGDSFWKPDEKSGSPSGTGQPLTFKCINNCTKAVVKLTFQVQAKPNATSGNISIKNTNLDVNDIISSIPDVKKTLSIKSIDATLKSLSINGTPVENFSSNTFTYNIPVSGDVATAEIKAVTNNSKATLKKDLGNRTVNLEYGDNSVLVTAVSEAGTEQTYTLNITREDTRSTDTTLSGITIDGEALNEFKSSKYKYTVKKYKLETIKIEGITSDPKAKAVTAGPEKLIIGENTFIITVTSENGDTSTYTVVINNIDTNISKMLRNLSITGYNINFDKNNYNYSISYNKAKFKDLRIIATSVAKSDEVTITIDPDINNNKDLVKKLKPGDKITVTVTGIDGQSSEYIITITKDNRPNFFMFLWIFIFVVLLVVFVVLYLKKHKNDLKKPNKKKEEPKKVVKETNKEPEEEVKEEKVEEKDSSPVEDEYTVVSRRERRRRGEQPAIELVGVENTEEETTKELSTKELNLK